ncbi:hypothetical protein FGO68_gene8485 [Halteria grandinella]|uniref:Uncharacterized protein n=1 Tax=Halteria grandinella TaxID=5974 RepID=A0A8J8NXQ4_HALGN|nr:hypothetical protein FGO68_gene8485 [Halteria grandinella]
MNEPDVTNQWGAPPGPQEQGGASDFQTYNEPSLDKNYPNVANDFCDIVQHLNQHPQLELLKDTRFNPSLPYKEKEIESYNLVTFGMPTSESKLSTPQKDVIMSTSDQPADRRQYQKYPQQQNIDQNALIEQISLLNLNANNQPRGRQQNKEDNLLRSRNDGDLSVIVLGEENRRYPVRLADKTNANSRSLSQKCISRDKSLDCKAKKRREKKIADSEAVQIDPLKPYELIYINQNDEDVDIQCDICLDYEHDDEDQIVICDLCNAAGHQSCYGGDIIDRIPDGNWFCERCKVLVEDRNLKCTEIKCFLCDDIDGLMKCIDQKTNLWAHSICVNWIPDIYFTDEHKNKIAGVLNERRFDLFCNYCRKSKKGACIQCDFRSCHLSYHVRCAVRRGVIKEWIEYQEILKDPINQEGKYIPLFCDKHERVGMADFKEGGVNQLQKAQNSEKKFRGNFIQKLTNGMKRLSTRAPNERKPLHKPEKILGKGINLAAEEATTEIRNLVDVRRQQHQEDQQKRRQRKLAQKKRLQSNLHPQHQPRQRQSSRPMNQHQIQQTINDPQNLQLLAANPFNMMINPQFTMLMMTQMMSQFQSLQQSYSTVADELLQQRKETKKLQKQNEYWQGLIEKEVMQLEESKTPLTAAQTPISSNQNWQQNQQGTQNWRRNNGGQNQSRQRQYQNSQRPNTGYYNRGPNNFIQQQKEINQLINTERQGFNVQQGFANANVQASIAPQQSQILTAQERQQLSNQYLQQNQQSFGFFGPPQPRKRNKSKSSPKSPAKRVSFQNITQQALNEITQEVKLDPKALLNINPSTTLNPGYPQHQDMNQQQFMTQQFTPNQYMTQYLGSAPR